MSDFLPIEPSGIGTAAIESLPSIFARATFIHAMGLVPMAKLLSHWWCRRSGDGKPLRFDSLYSGPSSLGSYSQGTDLYIEAMAAAFGLQHAHRHTLYGLRTSASRSAAGAGRVNRAWCVACFQEAERTGTAVYDRLLWMLPPVTRCIEHRLMLSEECPHCRIPQRYSHRSGDLGLCWKCNRSLFSGFSEWVPSLLPTFGERDCCELIEAISLGVLDNPSHDAFGRFQTELLKLLSPLGNVISSISRSSGLLRSLGKSSLPSLGTMLKRSHVAGVGLVAILTSPMEAAAAAGELEFERISMPKTARPRHPVDAVVIAKERLEQELGGELGRDAPSLPVLAKDLGVSEGFLRHHLPDLVRRYMTLRNRQSIRRTLAKMEAVQSALQNGILDDYLFGRINSQDSVVELLVERCGTGKAEARRQLTWALRRCNSKVTARSA
jgi:hypothetical protein